MSNGPWFVGADRLNQVLPMVAAIEALEEMFRSPSLPTTPQRQVVEDRGVSLLSMPSLGADSAGIKVVTVQPANPQRGLPLINGVYVLFDGETMRPVAIFDAGPLTGLRTGAVSGLATKYLAPPGATRLVVFGAGVQAEAHVHAMAAVRELSDVAIVGRTAAAVRGLVHKLESQYPVRIGTPADVATADIVCTCTTSTEPLFDGALLPRDVHINAVGAHSPSTRELDTTTIRRATVVVETKEAALAEAGDLLIPLGEGLEREDVITAILSEVVLWGPPETRREITVFKSVGVGFEDLAVASAAQARLSGGRR